MDYEFLKKKKGLKKGKYIEKKGKRKRCGPREASRQRHRWPRPAPIVLSSSSSSHSSRPSYPHITPIPLRPPPCRDAPRPAPPPATSAQEQQQLPPPTDGDRRGVAAAPPPPRRWRRAQVHGQVRLRFRLRCCSAPRFGRLAVRSCRERVDWTNVLVVIVGLVQLVVELRACMHRCCAAGGTV